MIIDQKMQKERNLIKSSKKQEKAAKLLDVYIRNNKKQALLVHTQQAASLAHISNLIANRFQVPHQHQLLYYNGGQIQITSEDPTLDVEDKAIIHLVDRRNVTQNLILNVRRLNIPRVEQFRVPSSQIIEDFIVRNIQQEEANRMFFVYTGRQLNPRNSFAEEFVENHSELFCLDEVKDEVVGQKRAKYEKRCKKSDKRVVETKDANSQEQGNNQNQAKAADQVSNKTLSNQNITASATDQRQKKNEKEEIKTPNFKKKTQSQEVNLGDYEAPVIQAQPSSNQQSTSLVIDQNLPENKSTLVQNPFYNEGSSISSIFLEENHNPQTSKKLDEASVMFHSAYIGLNNESLINQPLNSRGGSIIANQSDSREQEIKQETITSKMSFSFDNRAPEMIIPERQLNNLASIGQEQIIEESKEDYTQSKDLSIRDCESGPLDAQKSKVLRENSKDLSGYELQSVENHQLSASAQFEVDMFENKDSPNKDEKFNDILIEDFQRSDSKTLQYLGVEIQPIAHNHHQGQSEESKVEEKDCIVDEKMLETPHFDYATRHVDVYLIEHEDLARPTDSQVIEQKQERETNRYSNSNFYSSNSSRARQHDTNNEYNFGQFERVNRNRFSGFRQGTPRYHDSEFQAPLSENHNQVQQFKDLPIQDNREQDNEIQVRRSIEEDRSLNIVELPMEARIKENSSLLIDCDSKYDFNYFNNQDSGHFKIEKKVPSGKNDYDHQDSGIDELNKLFSHIGERPQRNEQQSEIKIVEVSHNDESSSKGGHQTQSELQLINHEHQRPNSEEQVAQTSLNLRMSQKQSKNYESISSPIIIKEIKELIESSQSLQKIEVKNSLPYFNSYTRSISSELRFTSHKQTYNIGDFVFNCDISAFNPLNFFVDALGRQDSLQIYRSYP